MSGATKLERQDSRRIRRDRTSDISDSITVDTLIKTEKNDVQEDLEGEKQRYTKVSRINDRIMGQLEEATIRAAALEAQFRVRERNWKDKIDGLEVALAKVRSEEQVERARMKDELASADEKIKYREKEHDTRVDRKKRDHDDAIKALKKQIEAAKKNTEDADKAGELEAAIRQEKALANEAEADARKFQTEYENAQDALENVKAKVANLKEKIDETEKGNLEMSTGAERKASLDKQLKELERRVDELEEIELNAKDNQDVIAELKNKIRAAKTAYDESVAERAATETRVSRAKSGLDAGKADRTVNTSRLDALPSRTASSLAAPAPASPTLAVAATATRDRGRSGGGSALERIRERQAGRAVEGRGDERRIKGARQNVKNFERDAKKEIDALEKQAAKAESALAKVDAAFRKCEEAEKAVQKLIKQEKEWIDERVEVMRQQQEVAEKSLDKAAVELKRLQKASKDAEFERDELKTKLDKLTADLNAKKKELANVEMATKQRERTLERADRELRGLVKTLQDTTFKWVETEEARADTQQTQEETHVELAVTQKDLQLEVHTLEAEIYDQTEQREALVKLNAELLKEVFDLRWYFKPQREKGAVENRVYGTREFDEIAKQHAGLEKELDDIKKEVSSTNLENEWRAKSMQDLKKDLDKTLQEMDPELRGDILFELRDLTNSMTVAGFNQRRILAIVLLLAKHDVYPGAIRELSVLTKMQDELHVMQRPEMLLKMTHREWVREAGEEDAPSFRRRLLEKLVQMRMRRTNRSYQQCEDFIFYGEERNEEEIEEELGEIGADESGAPADDA